MKRFFVLVLFFCFGSTLISETIVVSDQKNNFAKKLAKNYSCEFVGVELGHFADSESIIKITEKDKLKGKDVIVVYQYSFDAGRSINDQLLEALFLVHQVKVSDANKVSLLMPYLPYVRQCEDVEEKGVGVFQAVCFFCDSLEIDKIIACEVHEDFNPSMLKTNFEHITLEKVWLDILLKELTQQDLENVCFFSPDRGGVDSAKRVAKIFALKTGINPSFAFVEKKRVGYDKTEVVSLNGEVAEKTVVLIDDIIDTGGTAIRASEVVLQNGAKKIIACFAHGVFSGDAISYLEKGPMEKIWVTNSISFEQKILENKPVFDDLIRVVDISEIVLAI
jgi:ribose-phosphate pyrophosphokinase